MIFLNFVLKIVSKIIYTKLIILLVNWLFWNLTYFGKKMSFCKRVNNKSIKKYLKEIQIYKLLNIFLLILYRE